MIPHPNLNLRNSMWSFALLLIISACSPSPHSVEVMSYNIRLDLDSDGSNKWDNRKAELTNMLVSRNLDFIGIQEALHHQTSYLDSVLVDYSYVGFGRDGKDTKSEACPLFFNTKTVKLLDWEQFWLSETPNVVSSGWDATINRIAVAAEFVHISSRDTFLVINTHFDHQGPEARLQSAKLVVQKMTSIPSDRKVVLLGDFNAEPDSEPMTFLRSSFKDTFLDDKQGNLGTFQGFDTSMVATRRIDYILTRNLESNGIEIITQRRTNGLYLSDHFPVWAKLSF